MHVVQTIPVAEAEAVVAASLRHLTALATRTGRFVYAHEAGDIGAVHEGYNLLRHCGTLWFMARAARLLPASATPDLMLAISRVTGYVGGKLTPPPWSAPERPSLGLVSNGAIKLGGLGLGLLALTEVRALASLPLPAAALPHPMDETIQRMRQYALDEIEDADFRHKRDAVTGAVLPFRSDYYTGEAIFGLLMSGPAPDELVHVTTALMRRAYGWAEQSHWMAYAACEAAERGVVPEALGAAYLTGLMEAILSDPKYRHRRQSTPIACRTEALTRVLMLGHRMPGLLDPGLLQRIRDHAAENLVLQGDWYAAGQFWKGDDARKVQIDYIQHNATAFLHWKLLDEA